MLMRAQSYRGAGAKWGMQNQFSRSQRVLFGQVTRSGLHGSDAEPILASRQESHDAPERDDPAADDFPSLLQFGLSGRAPACRVIAPMATLF